MCDTLICVIMNFKICTLVQGWMLFKLHSHENSVDSYIVTILRALTVIQN